MSDKRTSQKPLPPATREYSGLLGGISELLEAARHVTARAVNAFMTATYWEIGRRIVEHEQGGQQRAGYGEAVLDRLASDLAQKFGRGFARPNLIRARQLYVAFPNGAIRSTLSNEFPASNQIRSTVSNESCMPQVWQTPFVESGIASLRSLATRFPL